jgi:electron transfer flavoprotein alpha subunit
MTSILIVAEHAGGKLNASTAKCVKAAGKLGAAGSRRGAGFTGRGLAAQVAELSGVGKVVVVERAEYSQWPRCRPRRWSSWLPVTIMCWRPPILLARTAAARGGLLGVGQVSDLMSVDGPPSSVYAGNALVTVVPPAAKLVATIRSLFAAAAGGAAAPIESVTTDATLPTHTL